MDRPPSYEDCHSNRGVTEEVVIVSPADCEIAIPDTEPSDYFPRCSEMKDGAEKVRCMICNILKMFLGYWQWPWVLLYLCTVASGAPLINFVHIRTH